MSIEALSPPYSSPPESIDMAPQALQPVSYQLAHGSVEVHGAESRYTLAVSLGQLASPYVVVYVNGFGAFKKTMRGVRNATANENLAGLSNAPIRSSNRSPMQDITDPTTLHVDQLEAILDDLPNNQQLLNETENGSHLSFDKVHLACHSYGGEVGVKYALKHPGDVANLILIKPVGQEKPDWLRFLPRLQPFAQKELLPFLGNYGPDFSLSDAWKALKHFGSRPTQTLGEGLACIRSDNRHVLWGLGEQMGLALITGENDNLIPPGPIEDLSAHLVHYYARLETDHLGPQKHPQLVARTVANAIRVLDERGSGGVGGTIRGRQSA